MHPYTKGKQLAKTRIRPTLKQLGDISNKVRQEVRERSGSVCELCHASRASEMAHLVGRKHLTERTTAEILLHVCTNCHRWLDGTPEGIRYKRERMAK